MELNRIKPSDRVTYLLNYLYLVISNNQLLNDSHEMHLVKEIFMSVLDSYMSIMASWVSKGELKDPKQEFFIRANPKVFDKTGPNDEKISSKK